MVVKEEKPITLAEVYELIGDSEKSQDLKQMIKKFNKMSSEDAKKMKEELIELNIIKLKEMHLVKIIDFKPIDASELNKVISDVSLDQEEVTKILNVVNKY